MVEKKSPKFFTPQLLIVLFIVIIGAIVLLAIPNSITSSGNFLFASNNTDANNLLSLNESDFNINNSDSNSTFVCTNSQVRCNGTDYTTCVDNTWVNNGKVTDRCGVECLAGEKCLLTNNYSCQNNKWVNNGDINGKCGYVKECDVNETICKKTTYFTCENSKWKDLGKIDGKCGFTLSNPSSTQRSSNSVTFTKSDYGSEKDCITSHVCITRDDTKGIYNSVSEDGYAEDSPKDTEWYFGEDCKASLDFTTWAEASNHDPQGTINVPACLYLTKDNLYYNITFTSFSGSNSGGGFSYIRSRVTLNTGTMETCNTGQDNCQGTNHLICQDNSWVNEGDVNGFCGYNPVCSFAQTDCNGTNYLTCDNNYDWTNNGDMNGFCGYNPVCSFGDTICNGTNYYTCDNNYDWTNKGDVNGQCGYSPICLKPETSCLDTNFLTCDNNYSWTNNGDVNGQCGVNWPTVLFRKPIDGNRDCITSNVCLTRGATQGLYNSAKEAVYSSKSPIDTNWYFGSYCKDGLTLRDWNSALPGNKAPNSVNVPACLYLATDNQYYNIIFTYWRAGGGGDFNYTRTRTSPYNWNN